MRVTAGEVREKEATDEEVPSRDEDEPVEPAEPVDEVAAKTRELSV